MIQYNFIYIKNKRHLQKGIQANGLSINGNTFKL